jgi:hypothetical protein
MEIRVDIPEELGFQAESRGVPVKEYAEELLAEGLALRSTDARKRMTGEEIRDWLDSFAQFSHKIPELPEVITRDWIYGDHD